MLVFSVWPVPGSISTFLKRFYRQRIALALAKLAGARVVLVGGEKPRRVRQPGLYGAAYKPGSALPVGKAW